MKKQNQSNSTNNNIFSKIKINAQMRELEEEGKKVNTITPGFAKTCTMPPSSQFATIAPGFIL